MDEAKYQDWLSNPSAERVVLYELELIDGAYFLASNTPYVRRRQGEAPVIYKSLSLSSIEFIDSYASSMSAGELILLNDGSISWMLDSVNVWGGLKIKVLWGSKDWLYDDFKLLFVGTIRDVMFESKGSVRVSFYDQSLALQKHVSVEVADNEIAERVLEGTLLEVIFILANEAGISEIEPIYFSDFLLNVNILFSVSSKISIDSVMHSILEPLGVYHRISLSGDLLQLIHTQNSYPPTYSFNKNDIVLDSFFMGESIQPASSVSIEYNGFSSKDSNPESVSSNLSFSSDFFEKKTYQTALLNIDDAMMELSRRILIDSKKIMPFSFDLFARGSDLRVGDKVKISHPFFDQDHVLMEVKETRKSYGNTNKIGLLLWIA